MFDVYSEGKEKLMNRSIVVCAFAWVFLLVCPVQAFQSQFGFQVDLPSHWVAINPEVLKKGKLPSPEDGEFKTVDKKIFNGFINAVRKGNAEVYVRKSSETGSSFVDNINVMRQPGAIPKTASDIEKQCPSLSAEFSRLFGKPTNVYECGSRSVAGHHALFLEFDGVSHGTRCIQYQVQWSPDTVLVFTATCRHKNLEVVRKEFTTIMNSLR
jgi:hypothetical protein